MTGKFLISGTGARARVMEQELLDRGMIPAGDGQADLIVLVNDADTRESIGGIRGDIDFAELEAAYEKIAAGFLKEFTLLYGRLVPGGRIALVTEEESSVTSSRCTGKFGTRMGLASCNMMMKLLFNELSQHGYTFRVYAGKNLRYGAEYIVRDRSLDGDSVKHSDELKIRMRTDRAQDIAW